MVVRNYPDAPVLLVDDESEFLGAAKRALGASGITNVLTSQDSRSVRGMLQDQPVSVMVLDMLMPHESGSDLLQWAKQHVPETPVVMVTAVDELEQAVRSMRDGAFDYLVKPVDSERLASALRRAIDFGALLTENRALRRRLVSPGLARPNAFSDIVTQNATMHAIFQYIEAVAETSLPVLVTGETGVGKELFARAVHSASQRSGRLVTVNAAGIDAQVFADTLFGHRRGAFTGADRDRPGLIERAAGGTLFLDEIGDLDSVSQVKLLRLLQDGSYYPVGADLAKVSDARVVAATNRDPDELRRSPTFRRDLFYRLQMHHVHVPPLRERKDDIPLLVEHFLGRAAVACEKPQPTVSGSLVRLLRTHTFPGNVRELEGLMFDAVSTGDGPVLQTSSVARAIGVRPDPAAQDHTHPSSNPPRPNLDFPDVLPSLREAEEALIDEALRRADGNQTTAARLLGVSRQALNNRLRRKRSR